MSRPFDEARYKGLLEGLEISEVRLSEVVGMASTFRIDPEYFQRIHLADTKRVQLHADRYVTFSDLGLTVDASAFYPSIEEYYGTGDLPFLRVADVDDVIDFEKCTTVPGRLCNEFPTLRRVNNGDVVFTKGGSVARIGLVTKSAAASRDLIFLNTSKLSSDDQKFLYVYFQTDFFNRLLLRSSSQTAQPHLTITLVRDLPIFVAGIEFKARCAEVVRNAYRQRDSAIAGFQQAEQALLRALGLQNWCPPQPLTYACRSSDVFAAERLDADFFAPKYEVMIARMATCGECVNLGSLLEVNQRGKQPIYSETGLPVVNSKHVLKNEVRLNENNAFATAVDGAMKIENGDVLMNGTGVGTIGRAAAYLHDATALPDNHVTILRPHAGAIDPIYLSVYLNTIAGQWQVEKYLRGSSGQIEVYPIDIAQFKICLAPQALQQEIRGLILSAFAARHKANSLLDIAKQSVGVAIERGEAAAMKLLSKSMES